MESCVAPFRPIPREPVVQMYKCCHLPRERIDEQGDDDDGDDYTRQIDRRYFIDLRFRRTFQGLVTTVPKDAEICAAVLDLVRVGGAVLAATAELSPAEHFKKKKENLVWSKNYEDSEGNTIYSVCCFPRIVSRVSFSFIRSFSSFCLFSKIRCFIIILSLR